MQNVFVHILQSEKLKTIFKDILTLDTDFELVKLFLDYDPTIAKSKVISKWAHSSNRKTTQR